MISLELFLVGGKILDVQDPANNINEVKSILLSRNRPVAFIVGVAGFLGSHLAERLIEHGIQVVGVDNLSTGSKLNLVGAVKDKNFHLINQSIADVIFSKELASRWDFPRLDYAFFAAASLHPQELYSQGLINFLNLINILKEKNKHPVAKPRVVFVSSINLYDNKLDSRDQSLKDGEIRFAKFVKYHKINGRIIRCGPLFGPRMNFEGDDPIIRLIQSSLNNQLPSEQVALDFSTRALFVEDGVNLIIKSVLSGSTAGKIYDGVSYQPIKIAEIKQILLDPLWHESKNFQPSELPPWPTPNLEKTMRELSWRPQVGIITALKRTLSYFKDHNIEVPKLERQEWQKDLRRWSFTNPEIEEDEDQKGQEKKESHQPKEPEKRGVIMKNLLLIVTVSLIIFGLVWPAAQIIIGSLTIRQNVKASALFISSGDFKKAQEKIKIAKDTVDELKKLVSSLAILKRVGILSVQIDQVDQMIASIEEGIDGILYATLGTESLFATTKIISGEDPQDPGPLYQRAYQDLTTASYKIEKLKAKLADKKFIDNFPLPIRDRAADLVVKLNLYTGLVNKAKAAALLLPQVTALDGLGSPAGGAGKKTYLILFQNNLELRPAGGFIGSFGLLTFEKGRLIKILVDDIYNLDGGLKEIIAPPVEFITDLGQNRLYLRDANFEPDFPSSARIAQTFYKKEAGESVFGVLALDLWGSAKLLSAVGGLDLPEYGEKVDGNNLFEKAIAHAEVNFFPGSQAKKNYLTSLQNQLFNKIFYVSNQNWPAIISALAESLETKHLLIYLSEPELFSYLASENWSGVLPRGKENQEGVFHDFLATVESNMGANKANFYLQRKFKLETQIGKEGGVSHRLRINYQNNSPSDVFPAGKYKNRFKIYLPLGAKLTRALFSETDITSSFQSFSDYGRTGYSTLLVVEPRQQKTLILEYTLKDSFKFSANRLNYRLDVIKQAGVDKDSFDWNLTYPINLAVETDLKSAKTTSQELTIQTDLSRDRSFEVNFRKK